MSISGVFDLEPLVQVSFNGDLRLDRGDGARDESAFAHAPRVRAPLLLAVGGDETSEFIRQTAADVGALAANAVPPGCARPLVVLAGATTSAS